MKAAVGLLLIPNAWSATLVPIELRDLNGQAVADAVIFLNSAKLVEPIEPAQLVIDQLQLSFVPRVVVVKTGEQVHFPNSDATRHHVYSFSNAKTFELKLYKANEAPPVVFDKPGLVLLGCNIHDSMRGFIYVSNESVYAVSDAQGRVQLPAAELPLTTTITLWHEDLAADIVLNVDHQQLLGSKPLSVTLPITLKPAAEPERSTLRNRLQRFKKSGD